MPIAVPVVDDLDASDLPGTRWKRESAGNREIDWRFRSLERFDANSHGADRHELWAGSAWDNGNIDDDRGIG
jgi:hypothetical protein